MIKDVSTVILAGGRSRRFHGRDKARITLAGRPLIRHAVDAWHGRVEQLLISSRDGADYTDLGLPVIFDSFPSSEGPLAGIARALERAVCPYIMTVPCDAPGLDAGICLPLLRALRCSGADVAVAHDGCRIQPLIALYRRDTSESLQHYLATGRRSVQAWHGELRHVIVRGSEGMEPFANINTWEDLAAAEAHNRITPRDSA